jgi:type III secretory pathway component EscT
MHSRDPLKVMKRYDTFIYDTFLSYLFIILFLIGGGVQKILKVKFNYNSCLILHFEKQF